MSDWYAIQRGYRIIKCHGKPVEPLTTYAPFDKLRVTYTVVYVKPLFPQFPARLFHDVTDE
jgi:hypothetical protein